jgi:hypothetical protein
MQADMTRTQTTPVPAVAWAVDRKISLGILWTMLVTFVGAVAYVTNFQSEVDKLNSNLISATETLKAVTIAIERNTAQIVKGDRTIGVLEQIVKDQARRIDRLEASIK